MLLAVPAGAWAQEAPAPQANARAADEGAPVEFSADQVTYESDPDVVTATGSVRSCPCDLDGGLDHATVVRLTTHQINRLTD